MRSGIAMFVWLDESARAHGLVVGTARGRVHRGSKPGTGLRQSWMERAYHSGFNLCETRPFPDRVLWRCMAPV